MLTVYCPIDSKGFGLSDIAQQNKRIKSNLKFGFENYFLPGSLVRYVEENLALTITVESSEFCQ